MLLFNSKLGLFLYKLNTRWLGPFEVIKTYPYGVVKVRSFFANKILKVNGHMLKHFYGDQVSLVGEIRLEDPRARVMLGQ